MRSEGVPPFAVHARELLARSMDPDTGSAGLARVILKDLGLTSQILRTANSPAYNRSGRPLGSIAHAISMLGWDAVRDLVSAMRFVEHYARYSPGLRELIMFSLLTATHGRQVACLLGYPRPEEAYICGLLRNLGGVLLARFQSMEYSEMLLLMEQEHLPEKDAAKRIFDFDVDELAGRLAVAWNLPDPICECLKDGVSASTAEQKCLASITSYGHQLTKSLYGQAKRLEALRLPPLVNPHGRPCLISPCDLRGIVDCAVEDTAGTFQTLRIPLNSLLLAEQAEKAREKLAGADATPDGSVCRDTDVEVSVAELQVQAGNFEIGELICRLLDLLTVRGGFRRALFALMTEDRNFIRGKLASGPTAEADTRAFNLPLLRNDAALTAAISRKQDLWIDRRTDRRYDGSRVVSMFDPVRFLLLPVVVDNVVTGVIYADHSTGGWDEGRALVNQVRGLIGAAIARKRLS